MTDPLVCCIMLTRDRPALAARALRSFRAQAYLNKCMLVLNSGEGPIFWGTSDVQELCFVEAGALCIGALRNLANADAIVRFAPDIFVHWDDDDWSHPRRIEEQVALLESTGAEAVGYREMLFWRDCDVCRGWHVEVSGQNPFCAHGQAWLYSNGDRRYCLGTSLCYRRQVWEDRRFPNLHTGEDFAWCSELVTVGERAFEIDKEMAFVMDDHGHGDCVWTYAQPRMIAGIHGGNTTSTIDPAVITAARVTEWTRRPEWDARVRAILREA